MNAAGVHNSSEFPAEHLISVLGGDVVLLPSTKGMKGPRWEGWQKSTIEKMLDADFIRDINSAEGIAVLTGEPSGGLCSIDIDYDEMVEPFLALNPKLRETLRSRGRRGCNLWVRIDGAYPRPCVIKQADGSEWGEWRSTGVCTMIHGLHPEGMTYTRSPEVPPITMRFEDIQWPDDLRLPWLATEEELPAVGDESDDPIIQRYGVPVFYAKARDGEMFVKGINEAYWAGLYAAENIILHEPDERTFFRYTQDSGLYSVISPDAVKQDVSFRMLEMSRHDESLSPLENLRTDKILNSVISQLRGIS